MTTKKRINRARAKRKELQAEVHKMDLWFIGNISSADWSEKIREYWLAKAKIEDLTDVINSLTGSCSTVRYSPITLNSKYID